MFLYFLSLFCHFLNLSLTFSKKLKCFLIAYVHSLSRFHLWKYCLSFFYFLQCCRSGITLGGLSHVRLSPPEELCTLLPHSLSPKTTFFKSVTSLNLFPVVFCWNSSAWFHVSQTIFHLIYAFCTLGHIGLFPDTRMFLFLCLYPRGSLFPSTLYLSLTTPSYMEAAPVLTEVLISPFSKLLGSQLVPQAS